MDFMLYAIKFGILFAVTSAAIWGLSGFRAGRSDEKTNHLRGWFLVAIMTVAAIAVAFLGHF